MPPAAPGPAAGLRVLHWNVHSWTDAAGRRNAERVVALVARTAPDVVSLVEVDEPAGRPAPLQELASGTGYHAVFVPALEYDTDERRGRYGNALLSREPLLGVRHHGLIRPPRVYDGTEPSEPRSLLLGCVPSQAGPVWVGTTHLPCADGRARAAAAGRALAIMSALPRPWLLVGDFNLDIAVWREQHPWTAAHPQAPQPTFPADDPTDCIDFCVTPAGERVHARVLDVPGSDHLPLVADLHPAP